MSERRAAIGPRAVSRPASRSVLCLLLLSLAWLQVAIAGHQFEHVAGDRGAACAVCAQLDRLEVPADSEHSAATDVAPAAMDAVQPCVPRVTHPLRGYFTRAPPSV